VASADEGGSAAAGRRRGAGESLTIGEGSSHGAAARDNGELAFMATPSGWCERSWVGAKGTKSPSCLGGVCAALVGCQLSVAGGRWTGSETSSAGSSAGLQRTSMTCSARDATELTPGVGGIICQFPQGAGQSHPPTKIAAHTEIWTAALATHGTAPLASKPADRSANPLGLACAGRSAWTGMGSVMMSPASPSGLSLGLPFTPHGRGQKGHCRSAGTGRKWVWVAPSISLVPFNSLI
jgi:hypothetical protein